MKTHVKTVLAVAGVGVGIVIGYTSPYATEIAGVSAVLGVSQGILLGLKRYVKGWSKERDTVGVALAVSTCIVSCALVVGIVRVQLESSQQIFVCEKVCRFTGTVITSGEQKDSYQELVVKASHDTEHVMLRVPPYPHYVAGDILDIEGKVSVPDVIFPHSDTTSSVTERRSFDYAAYLHTRNIGSESYYPQVTHVGKSDSGIFMLRAYKDAVIRDIAIYVTSPAASLASGMLVGDSSMSKELIAMFRASGLSHIIVLSGFNIAIVIGFMMMVLRYVPIYARVLCVAMSVVLFICAVGGEVSLIRAGVMAMIGLTALVFGRVYVAAQALLVSLLGIVLYEPYSLMHDVSLHLSFIATAGIIYISQASMTLAEKCRVPVWMREGVAMTVSAYIATLPYTMYMFGTAQMYSVVANIFVVPVVPFAMFTTACTVALSHVSHYAALLCGYITSLLCNFILYIAKIISSLPGASLSVHISTGTALAMYLIIVAGITFSTKYISNETSITKSIEEDTGVFSY